ncbi:MAG TPA: arginine--tRNA ligase [Candidatus Paceibacterota bacterium]|nr:arginine--tRNA ligase [Candidatus Paceibacterota bacterium]
MFRSWLHDIITRRYPGHLFDILVPPDPVMGDFSTNVAMVAKHDARTVCDVLMEDGAERIAKCVVAGPGFVNIFLRDDWLRAQLHQHGVTPEGHGRTVIVEYGSPNAAKALHIGHVRSLIIGDALARVYRALGFNVIRWNYPGDWGAQYGQLIAAFKKFNESIETVADIERLYVKFHAEAANDPALEAAGREEFKKLEAGDQENRALWERLRDTAMAEHAARFATLGISFDVQKGESAYESDLPRAIEQLRTYGLVKESEGALVVPLEEFSLPVGMVRKSDGATLYLTRDIASLEDRIRTYAPARVLYVVANQQALHLEQLFAVAELLKRAGAISGNLPLLSHVKYGLVLDAEGKKFSTREGNVVPLADVLGEAIRRAGERNPASAEVIGIGAVKYNDLKQHPHTDIVFDWDAMLDLGGNSGPYIQYTYARLASIVAKSGTAGNSDRTLLVHPAERTLMRHMVDYGWVVSQCAALHALNGLALHLYELAVKANRFYEAVRINDDDDASRKAARLELVSAVMQQLKEGLGLLGIGTLERI